MRGIRLLAAVAATTLCVAASVLAISSAPSSASDWPSLGTAGPFLRAQIANVAHGRYAKAWTMLYPFHQDVVTQRSYTACEQSLPLAAPLRSATIVRVRRDDVRVAGMSKRVPGVAVTVRIGVKANGRDTFTFTHTFHLVPVHGRWTWLLSPQRYRLYSRGACGAAPAL